MSIFDDGYNLSAEQNQLVEEELIPILVQLAEKQIEPYYVVDNYFNDVNKFYCWGAARYRVRYFAERKIHSWLAVIQSVPEKIAIFANYLDD